MLAFQAQAENVVWGAFVADTELSDSGGSADGDGFVVGVKADVQDGIYVIAEYDAQSYDASPDLDVDTISAGLGFKTSISDNAQAYGSLSVENLELSVGGASADETGFGVRAGIGGYVVEQFWLKAELYYLDVDDADGLFYSARAGYDFAENIGAYAELRFGEYDLEGLGSLDRDDIRVGVYFRF
jgi:hypothetical protein